MLSHCYRGERAEATSIEKMINSYVALLNPIALVPVRVRVVPLNGHARTAKNVSFSKES